MIVLHYTGMPSAEAALARLCDPASAVSAHYLVLEDGQAVQMVPEERRAWHAGAGSWAGESDVNSVSIGIEIVNPGHEGGLPPYPAEQIEGLMLLLREVMRRWSIPPQRLLAHSDIAPARKEDPGELFPWDRLHTAGLGHWVQPAAGMGADALKEDDHGERVAELRRMLAAYGYGIEVSGRYDSAMSLVVAAFQRHFRPARVDGVADRSTVETLRALLAMLPRSANSAG